MQGADRRRCRRGDPAGSQRVARDLPTLALGPAVGAQTTIDARDPSISGQHVVMNGHKVIILGVMPDEFAFPEGIEMWRPFGWLRRVRQTTEAEGRGIRLQSP